MDLGCLHFSLGNRANYLNFLLSPCKHFTAGKVKGRVLFMASGQL